MKKTAFVIYILAFALAAGQLVSAQGTLYVSNLGLTPTGSASIGNNNWIAQFITTGTNSRGYTLNSIQLLMDAASGSPSGFNVSVYSDLSDQPHNNLGSLVGSTNPSTAGVFTYTASGILLSPSTPYYVVAAAATPVTQGAYVWSGANYGDYVGDQQWVIPDSYYSSPDGSSWTLNFRRNIPQLGIYATPIPEPATGALFAISLAYFGLLRLRQTK